MPDDLDALLKARLHAALDAAPVAPADPAAARYRARPAAGAPRRPASLSLAAGLAAVLLAGLVALAEPQALVAGAATGVHVLELTLTPASQQRPAPAATPEPVPTHPAPPAPAVEAPTPAPSRPQSPGHDAGPRSGPDHAGRGVQASPSPPEDAHDHGGGPGPSPRPPAPPSPSPSAHD